MHHRLPWHHQSTYPEDITIVSPKAAVSARRKRRPKRRHRLKRKSSPEKPVARASGENAPSVVVAARGRLSAPAVRVSKPALRPVTTSAVPFGERRGASASVTGAALAFSPPAADDVEPLGIGVAPSVVQQAQQQDLPPAKQVTLQLAAVTTADRLVGGMSPVSQPSPHAAASRQRHGFQPNNTRNARIWHQGDAEMAQLVVQREATKSQAVLRSTTSPRNSTISGADQRAGLLRAPGLNHGAPQPANFVMRSPFHSRGDGGTTVVASANVSTPPAGSSDSDDSDDNDQFSDSDDSESDSDGSDDSWATQHLFDFYQTLDYRIGGDKVTLRYVAGDDGSGYTGSDLDLGRGVMRSSPQRPQASRLAPTYSAAASPVRLEKHRATPTTNAATAAASHAGARGAAAAFPAGAEAATPQLQPLHGDRVENGSGGTTAALGTGLHAQPSGNTSTSAGARRDVTIAQVSLRNHATRQRQRRARGRRRRQRGAAGGDVDDMSIGGDGLFGTGAVVRTAGPTAKPVATSQPGAVALRPAASSHSAPPATAGTRARRAAQQLVQVQGEPRRRGRSRRAAQSTGQGQGAGDPRAKRHFRSESLGSGRFTHRRHVRQGYGRDQYYSVVGAQGAGAATGWRTSVTLSRRGIAVGAGHGGRGSSIRTTESMQPRRPQQPSRYPNLVSPRLRYAAGPSDSGR